MPWIKINDDFEFERDRFGWNLRHYRDGINPKTKEPTRAFTTTYHATLAQVCIAVLESSQERVESLEDILVRISKAKAAILAAIKGTGND